MKKVLSIAILLILFYNGIGYETITQGLKEKGIISHFENDSLVVDIPPMDRFHLNEKLNYILILLEHCFNNNFNIIFRTNEGIIFLSEENLAKYYSVNLLERSYLIDLDIMMEKK